MMVASAKQMINVSCPARRQHAIVVRYRRCVIWSVKPAESLGSGIVGLTTNYFALATVICVRAEQLKLRVGELPNAAVVYYRWLSFSTYTTIDLSIKRGISGLARLSASCSISVLANRNFVRDNHARREI